MGPRYEPAPGARRFAAGTPPILGLVLVDEGVALVEEAGIEGLRARERRPHRGRPHPVRRTAGPARLAPRLAPGPRRRAHIALARDDAEAVRGALAAAGVVGDFRRPDLLRLGPAPLYTTHVEVWDALERLRRLSSPRAPGAG